MDSGRDRMRMNAEGDRLSSLPDDLIHKILSFISIKQAIETSALSCRWRFIWTTMPYLNFSNEDFPTLPKFSKFCTRVLSYRNNQIEVSSVKLSFCGKISQGIVKRIMNYTFSHNVQQLTVTCFLEKKTAFSLPPLVSQSLKCLTLTHSYFRSFSKLIMPTSTWDLPALTTLHLDSVTLYDGSTDNCIDLFSKCVNLKNLTLKKCRSTESNVLSISHPRLSNLKLEQEYWTFVNVVAPELENLIIRNCSGEHLISTPKLAFLLLKDYDYRSQLSTDGFPSLEKVDLCISGPREADAHKIVCLLQQFQSVQILTLNSEIVELLSSHVELISHQPSPFANLHSLKIYPAADEYMLKKAQNKVIMSTEVKNYFLDSSPSATFTMVSPEEKLQEITDARNAASAQWLISDLKVLLDSERVKAPMESHKAKMHAQGKEQVVDQKAEPSMEMQHPVNGGRMAEITSCWEDLTLLFEQSKENTRLIISTMQQIEALLSNLPTSKRANMQACFSRLCAEADTFLNRNIDGLKMKCDMNLSRLSVYFHELATASQPSS